MPKFISESSHPGAIICQLLFKLLALVSYLLMNMFIDDLVLTYITVLLLCVLDFWVVKNITGRLLVGLRWWNEIRDDGSEQWVFESLDESKMPSLIDCRERQQI